MARPTAERLFKAIMADEWPDGMAALVDFGLDGYGSRDPDMRQKRYEALHGPIRAKEITLEQLDAALGDGPALTRLVNRCRNNPHKGIVFTTAWDNLTQGDEE